MSFSHIILMILLVTCRASASVRCDFDSLSKKCEKFLADGPYFEKFPDGSLIPNPVSTGRLAREVRIRKENSAEDADYQKRKVELALNVRQGIRDRIGNQDISPRSKDAIVEMAAELARNYFASPNPVVMVPDPLASENPVLKPIPLDQVPQFFSSFGDEGFKANFSKELSRYAVAWRVFNEGYTREEIEALGPLLQPPNPDRINELFKKTQQSVIDEIKAGRTGDQLTKAEQDAIKRVETTRVFDPRQLPAASLIQARCAQAMGQNAMYMHNYHAIVLCPGAARLSDEAQMEILGHELTHPIAPCASQFGVYEVDEAAVLALKNSDPLHIPFKKASDRDRATLFDMISASKKPSNFILGSFVLRVSPDIVQEFEDKGLIKLVTPGIDSKSYPFAKVTKCISQNAGTQKSTEEEIRSYVDRTVTERQKMMGAEYDPEKDRDSMTMALTKYPNCFSPDGDDQIEEAFPNWMGVRVLGKVMKAKGAVYSADQTRQAIGWKVGLVCKSIAMAPAQVSSNSTQLAAVTSAKKTAERAGDAHPYEKTHLENFILTDPNVRAALDCEKDDKAPACLWEPLGKRGKEMSGGGQGI